jgi:DNA-directed RNA polymerase subunit RPC12/RpoP
MRLLPGTARREAIVDREVVMAKGSWIDCQERQAEQTSTSATRAMTDRVPAGSDVSPGTYSCTNCGYKLEVDPTRRLPSCPSCFNRTWHMVTGGRPRKRPLPGPRLIGANDARLD